MPQWTQRKDPVVFDAELLESKLAPNGDVVVRLAPFGGAIEYASNDAGQPNPDAGHLAGWIDVPNARRDLFVKSLQAMYTSKVGVCGALVDRDGYGAIQPLDALWVRVPPKEYELGIRRLLADLEIQCEDQAGAHYESDRFFTVYRIFACADASDFEHPPATAGDRRVAFEIELPVGPQPSDRAVWKPRCERYLAIEEHADVAVEVTSSSPRRATARVSFTLTQKPTESMVLGDLVLCWEPTGL